jgi:hypothetical protein
LARSLGGQVAPRPESLNKSAGHHQQCVWDRRGRLCRALGQIKGHYILLDEQHQTRLLLKPAVVAGAHGARYSCIQIHALTLHMLASRTQSIRI